MTASDHLSGQQFHSVGRQVDKDFTDYGHGMINQMEMVPRHKETDEAPSRVYRWAHRDAVKGYEMEGVPHGTYFSINEPDNTFKASDHELVSAPYSDARFRASDSSTGATYVATTTKVPPEDVRRER